MRGNAAYPERLSSWPASDAAVLRIGPFCLSMRPRANGSGVLTSRAFPSPPQKSLYTPPLFSFPVGKEKVERPFKTTDVRLALEDGSVWRGVAFGSRGTTTGEVVFNTSLTGRVKRPCAGFCGARGGESRGAAFSGGAEPACVWGCLKMTNIFSSVSLF